MNLETSIKRQIETTRQALSNPDENRAYKQLKILESLVETVTGKDFENGRNDSQEERFDTVIKALDEEENLRVGGFL